MRHVKLGLRMYSSVFGVCEHVLQKMFPPPKMKLRQHKPQIANDPHQQYFETAPAHNLLCGHRILSCKGTLQWHFGARPCSSTLQLAMAPATQFQNANMQHCPSFAMWRRKHGIWNCWRQGWSKTMNNQTFFAAQKTIRQQFVANHCNWFYAFSQRNTIDIRCMFSFCCRRSILYQKQNDIRWFKVLLTHTETHFVMSMWQLLHLSRFVRFWTTGCLAVLNNRRGQISPFANSPILALPAF